MITHQFDSVEPPRELCLMNFSTPPQIAHSLSWGSCSKVVARVCALQVELPPERQESCGNTETALLCSLVTEEEDHFGFVMYRL